MRPVILDCEEFRTKPESGVLGGKKRGGTATVGISLGSHAVQTGVGQVTLFLPQVFLPDVEEPVYGGIEVAGDTEALLQYGLDSPALVACRREGRGFIVFKSLLWNEPLSGDRFQMNLLEYSAGFQVPGPAGAGKIGNPPGPDAEYIEGSPAEPLLPATERLVMSASKTGREVSETDPVLDDPSQTRDLSRAPEEGAGTVHAVRGKPSDTSLEKGSWVLELQDGSTVRGEFETKLVEFETGSSSLKLELDKVQSLVFGDSITLDKITTSTGKQQSGLLLSTPIRFRTSRGVEEFEKEDIIKLSRSEE